MFGNVTELMEYWHHMLVQLANTALVSYIMYALILPGNRTEQPMIHSGIQNISVYVRANSHVRIYGGWVNIDISVPIYYYNVICMVMSHIYVYSSN